MRLFFCALLLTLAAAPLYAEYYLPEPKTRVFLLAADWRLEPSPASEAAKQSGERTAATKQAWKLVVKNAGPEHPWSINLFWLADRIDSNSICTGGHEQKMVRYLEEEVAPRQGHPLLVELVSTNGTDLFVAGITVFEAQESWSKASDWGSPLLGLSAEQVKVLGSVEAYEKAVRAASAEAWAKIDPPAKAPQGDTSWIKPGACTHGAASPENCETGDWACPRCKAAIHGAIWPLCESCCAELKICIQCNRKQ